MAWALAQQHIVQGHVHTTRINWLSYAGMSTLANGVDRRARRYCHDDDGNVREARCLSTGVHEGTGRHRVKAIADQEGGGWSSTQLRQGVLRLSRLDLAVKIVQDRGGR